MGQNKTVGADSISARDVVRSCTGPYRMHSYDSRVILSGAQRREPPILLSIIFYLLSKQTGGQYIS